MGLLKDKFKEVIKKEKLGSNEAYIPSYRTGIDIFDYITGYQSVDGNVELGLQGGKILMDVGKAGTGKTTVLIQQACNIADQFENSDVWHYDYERSTNKERVMKLTGWDEEHFNEKYTLFNKNISAETLYKACKQIEKVKLDNYDAIKLDSGKKDSDGNPIYVLPPTIIIVDSVALMAPEDIEDSDELKGQTGAMAIAKSNTNIFKRISSPCINANIMILLVNHLTQKIDINPMSKSGALVNYLGQDDAIPGGRTLIYLTNTLIKLTTAEKLTPDKEIGIKGYYLNGLIVKSRNTEAGKMFKMVFEQKSGINNLLTNFVNLKDLGRITGAGRSFKLDTCPDIKFAQKEFQAKYYENEELREAFDAAVEEEYLKLVSGFDGEIKPKKATTKKEKIKAKSKKEKTYTLVDEENEVYELDGKFYQIDSETGDYFEVEYE